MMQKGFMKGKKSAGKGSVKKSNQGSSSGKAPGTSTTSGASKRKRKAESREAAMDLPHATPEEVQAFLDEHSVDDRAKEKLLSLEPNFQTAVIQMGSMADSENQTKML